MRYIDAGSVHSILDYKYLIDCLKQAHTGTMPNNDIVISHQPDGGENKFVSLIGWDHNEIIVTKLVGVFPGNIALTPPQASIQGLVCLFDGKTGKPLLTADGEAMTFRKTAADSALGSYLLSRQESKSLLVVGAGGLAPHMIAAHRAARPSIKQIKIWNRTHARAQELANQYSDDNIIVTAIEDLEAAIPTADIISCVTMTEQPLIKGDLLRPGTHLDLVGAYMPTMREADDRAILRSSLFVDTYSGKSNTGDLHIPVTTGVIDWDYIQSDFFGLCQNKHPGRRSSEEITLCKNVGGAHLDLFTAKALLSRLGA